MQGVQFFPSPKPWIDPDLCRKWLRACGRPYLEIFVEKAFRPSAQRATWSSYKHSNTFKLLVGIMPSGAITFVSKLYSGSISDQKIVEKSGMIDNLENPYLYHIIKYKSMTKVNDIMTDNE